VVVRPGEPGGGRREQGRDGCERGRRYGARAGGGDDGRLGLLQQPLHGLAVGLVAELPRELEDPRGAQRGHPDPAAPAVDLGVAVLVGAPLGRERLLPPLPGLRHHLQLLLLLLPSAAPVLLRRLVNLDLQVVLRRLLLLPGGGAARAASVPTASGTFEIRLQIFASSLSRDPYLRFGSA